MPICDGERISREFFFILLERMYYSNNDICVFYSHGIRN
jgi:hypothetical protein